MSWHTPDRSRLVGVPLWGRLPVCVYNKLLVPDVVPAEVPTVLWLDCDTLVLGDISPLWDEGTGGNTLRAVQDSVVPLVSSDMGVARYRELGLRANAKYFNCGVMLMNMERWRQQRVSERALGYLKTYARDVAFLEQEGINAVLSDHWGPLDPQWNWSVSVGGGFPTALRRRAGQDRAFQRQPEAVETRRRQPLLRPLLRIHRPDGVRRVPTSTALAHCGTQVIRAGGVSSAASPERAVGDQDMESIHGSCRDPGRCEDHAMTDLSSTDSLRLSIVLATDTYEHAAARAHVAASPSRSRTAGNRHRRAEREPGTIDSSQLDGFGAVRVAPVPAPLSLPRARATGVRAASAPIVFVGETHCFPEPDMCNRLLAGFTDEHCAAVVPAIVNANPKTALSWASYLTDYGGWGPGRTSGPARAAAQIQRRVSARCVARTRRSPRRPARRQQRGTVADPSSTGLPLVLRPRCARQSRERDDVAGHASDPVLAGALIGAQRARRWTWGAASCTSPDRRSFPRARLACSVEHSIWRARAAASSRHDARYFRRGSNEDDRRGIGLSRIDAALG